MATKLVIVESPAKAKTIAKFLGRGYKVEASQGHVRDLPKSQIGVSPENDFEPKYITIRGRGDILNRIRKEARSASKVYLATDPDREGEAISWHLANVLGIDEHSPCRIEFNEVTMKAVKAAVKNPRGIDIDRVNAQQARRVLDRLVGYKISPILWAKVKKGLSAGRVQSVAAKMICDRENEIDTFLPEEYYNIAGRFSVGGAELTARFYGENGEKLDVHTREECDALLARAREGAYSVRSIKKSERRKLPAAPFTTSNLQQEASRKLNFNTGKTMQIAQQLYEGVELAGEGLQGLVTYIRTDSTRISDEALAICARNDQKHLRRALPARRAQHLQEPQDRAGRPRGHPPHGHLPPPRGHQGFPDARSVPPLPAHLRPLRLQPDDPGGVRHAFGGHCRRERPYLPSRRTEDEVRRLHRGLRGSARRRRGGKGHLPARP